MSLPFLHVNAYDYIKQNLISDPCSEEPVQMVSEALKEAAR
jgi:hypothetical protein